jgi:SAM-dependent methyltransferase
MGSEQGVSARSTAEADVAGEIREYWDEDAATYDRSSVNNPHRPHEQAAWAAALRRLLPAPPATVLDMGAGTGFLSLLLAAQGYRVTAVDISSGMLARLKDKAASRGLDINVTEADALNPPEGRFDAVVERHLIWTLPDPAAALAAWHAAAPDGRLVLLEGTWDGRRTSAINQWRGRARMLAKLILKPEPNHPRQYTEQMDAALPYHGGLTPLQAVRLVEASPWGQARIERLRDIEWATIESLSLLDSLLGTHPRWALTAGR